MTPTLQGLSGSRGCRRRSGNCWRKRSPSRKQPQVCLHALAEEPHLPGRRPDEVACLESEGDRERAHLLRDELRQELRAAQAAAFDDRVDPLDAVRAESLLTGLRLVGEATERVDARIQSFAGELN